MSIQCTNQSAVEYQNKKLVREFIEEKLAKGDLSGYKESRTPDFVCHAPDGDFLLDQDFANALEVQKAMRGFQISIIKLIAENDMVAVHWQAENETELGTGITWFRLSNGKFAEEWPSAPYFKKK